MELLFIKKIINYELYSKIANINLEGFFKYSPDKEELIKYIENNNLDYEFIINNDMNSESLTEEEETQLNDYVSQISNEFVRIKKIMEYIIVNVDLNKIIIPYYKNYDYNDTPAFIKKKVSKKPQLFNLQSFFIKNKINKTNNEIYEFAANIQEIDKTLHPKSLDDNKLMLFFVINKMLEIYNTYDKCIRYSLELLKECPYMIRYKEEYLVKIDEKYFNITNDEINISHFNQIKYANNKQIEKDKISIMSSSSISLIKNKNKNYELLFK